MMVRVWVVAAVVLLTAGLACGAGPDFADLDRDSNGTLEMIEIDRGASEVFKKHDTNGDGALDQLEYNAVAKDPSRFADLDRDGNGRIDIDEFREAARKRFEQVDRNHDGRIDAQEWGRRQRPIENPLVIFNF